jgi:hypothetical protein
MDVLSLTAATSFAGNPPPHLRPPPPLSILTFSKPHTSPAVFVYLKYKSRLVSFFTRAFYETGPEHVSLSKTELIIPFDDHVVMAVFVAACFVSIGMLMDFCLPVPLDMKKKKGDQQIYIQKLIRGALGAVIMVLQVYEVFYLARLQQDIVWAKTPLAEFLNAFSGGFFIYEMFGLCAV